MAEDRRYLLGLDAGNTVIKAVLFDTEGRQVAQAGLDGATSKPRPGHVERDLTELWSNAKEVIATCLRRAGVDPARIAGIGCAGHGNGLYALDRDGEPVVGIQSLDSRAADIAGDLAERHGDRLHGICRQKPWPSQTPVLLRWLKENDPAAYGRINTVLMCKDYVNFKLTGVLASEMSDMSGAGLVRLPEGVYDADLLTLYGLEDALSLLSPIHDPTAIIGHVTPDAAHATGLVKGTPVVAGYFDVVASAMGAGGVEPGGASIVLGSWSINQVFSDRPTADPSIFMISKFAGERFVNIEASATSASNLEWYVREFIERGQHHDDPFGYCNSKLAGVTPALDDPYFQPFLYGSGQGAGFRAGFYGVAGWHSEGHLLRAIFEGVVFEHRRHVEVLASAGVGFTRAALSGGGARSPHWPQMMADCLGVEVTVAESGETGALGAAIGAGIGCGFFGGYPDGISRMTRIRTRFRPDAAQKVRCDHRYRRYLELTERLQPFWADLASDRVAGGA